LLPLNCPSLVARTPSKPAELPVQAPVKFEMALNARAANALGLTVPPPIRLLAEGVIE
jgi:putative ABC transport system substrate-binding protein